MTLSNTYSNMPALVAVLILLGIPIVTVLLIILIYRGILHQVDQNREEVVNINPIDPD